MTLRLSMGRLGLATWTVAMGGIAQGQVTINVPSNAVFLGSAASVSNFSYASSVPSGFLVTGTVSHTASNLIGNVLGEPLEEETFRFRYDSAPTNFADLQLVATAPPGSVPVPAGTNRPFTTNSGFMGMVIPAGATVSVTLYSSVDTNPSGADASLQNAMQVTVDGTTPPSFEFTTHTGPYFSAGNVFDAGNSVINLGNVSTPFVMGTNHLFEAVGNNVISTNAASDLRIRVRNSAYPLQTMELQPVTGAFSGGTLSVLNMSVVSPTLPVSVFSNLQHSTLRGLTMPIGSTFTAELYDINDQGPGADSIWTNLRLGFNSGSGIGAPAPAPTSFVDMGVITLANSTTANALSRLSGAYTPGQVRWFKLDVPQQIDGAVGRYLHMWTSSSGTVGAVTDTVMNLYDGNGRWLGIDDDSGQNSFSMMTFGAPGATTPYPVSGTAEAPFNGKGGAGLLAGTYWISVAPYASGHTFADAFVATSPFTSSFTNGVRLNVISNVLPPDQYLSGSIQLQDVGPFGSGLDRTLNYVVKQGTVTVITGSVVATGAIAPFNIEVSGLASGAATLAFDGSSFLRTTTNVNLNGSNQNLGFVPLQNGDVDNSGEVDAADIDLVIADFGSSYPGGSFPTADADVSGETDAADIDVVIANFGNVDH